MPSFYFKFLSMEKIEALNYIRLHKGYVPYIGIFEIYNDEDEIPQELIDMSIKEDKPKGDFMICGAELAEQLKHLKSELKLKQKT